ncbi:hypothetical protein WUBG_14213, partial [Wuchereria bancrofti]
MSMNASIQRLIILRTRTIAFVQLATHLIGFVLMIVCIECTLCVRIVRRGRKNGQMLE